MSQAPAETPVKVQRLGTEATAGRGYAGNVPTSAPLERDDIVRATGRPVEAWVKVPRDNNTDDALDTTPAEGLTNAFWPWRQAAVPIAISGEEEEKNSGEAKIIDLLEAKTTQAELGIQEFFNKKLLQGAGGSAITTAYVSPINGAAFLDPLPLVVAYDPTTSTAVGNINQLTYTWWRNQTFNSVSTTYAGFLKELRRLRNNCKKGPGGPPNLILIDQSVEELYVAALTARHQNPSYDKADIPFENVQMFGSTAVWDEFVPDVQAGSATQSTSSGTAWMLNTKFWGIKVSKNRNFTTTGFMKPHGQDARTAHILWMGGIGCSNRRKQGVMGGIDSTLTS